MRNLQILNKMMKKSNQFLASKQTPVGRKKPDDALNNAGVEKAAQKTCGCGPHRLIGAHSIRGLKKGALMTAEICVLCGW